MPTVEIFLYSVTTPDGRIWVEKLMGVYLQLFIVPLLIVDHWVSGMRSVTLKLDPTTQNTSGPCRNKYYISSGGHLAFMQITEMSQGCRVHLSPDRTQIRINKTLSLGPHLNAWNRASTGLSA